MATTDLTGSTVNGWRVTGKTEDRTRWTAECTTCGRTRAYVTRSLAQGRVLACCAPPANRCPESGCEREATSSNIPRCPTHEREALLRWQRGTARGLAARGRAQGPPTPLEACRARLARRVKTLPRI